MLGVSSKHVRPSMNDGEIRTCMHMHGIREYEKLHKSDASMMLAPSLMHFSKNHVIGIQVHAVLHLRSRAA